MDSVEITIGTHHCFGWSQRLCITKGSDSPQRTEHIIKEPVPLASARQGMGVALTEHPRVMALHPSHNESLLSVKLLAPPRRTVKRSIPLFGGSNNTAKVEKRRVKTAHSQGQPCQQCTDRQQCDCKTQHSIPEAIIRDPVGDCLERGVDGLRWIAGYFGGRLRLTHIG